MKTGIPLLMEHAGTLLARGDTTAAVARYREALARDPEQPRAEWSLLRAGALAEVDCAPGVLAGNARTGRRSDAPSVSASASSNSTCAATAGTSTERRRV